MNVLPQHSLGLKTWKADVSELPVSSLALDTLSAVECADDYNHALKTLANAPVTIQKQLANHFVWLRGKPADDKNKNPKKAANLYLTRTKSRLAELSASCPMPFGTVSNVDKTIKFAVKMANDALEQMVDVMHKLNGDDYHQNLHYTYKLMADWLKTHTMGVVLMPDSNKRNLSAEEMECALVRIQSDDWWIAKFKAFRREYLANVDIATKQVNDKNPYSSKRAQSEFKRRRRDSYEWMKQMELENEEGETVDMLQAFFASQSNPACRRTELLVRVRESQEYADELGHVGIFLTLTAPSKMHRNSHKWNATYPRQTQAYMTKTWSLARAKLARLGIEYYGVRIVEPHKDGTPHWHMMLFTAPENMHKLEQVVRFYFVREDIQELLKRKDKKFKQKMFYAYRNSKESIAYRKRLKHFKKQTRRLCFKAALAKLNKNKGLEQELIQKRTQLFFKKFSGKKSKIHRPSIFSPRFTSVRIDQSIGSAAAYISKYIAKNIGFDGIDKATKDKLAKEKDHETGKSLESSVNPVLTWCSDFRMRQFQTIGMPSVGVYRELRRLKEEQLNPAFKDIFAAADAANWKEYVKLMGGMCIGRKATYKAAYETIEGGGIYGDDVKKVIGVKVDDARVTALDEEKNLEVQRMEFQGFETEIDLQRTRFHEWVQKKKARQLDTQGFESTSSPNAVWGLSRGGAVADPWTSGNNCTPLSSVENKGGRSELPALAADKDQQVEKALREQRFDAWEIDLLLKGSRVSDGVHTYYLDKSSESVELRSIDESKSDKGKELEWTIEMQRRRAAGTETFLEDIPEW